MNILLQYQKMCILINQVIQSINITTYHNTIKMKPVDVKSSTYIDSSNDDNESNPKFETGDIVKISKYKNIFTNISSPLRSK